MLCLCQEERAEAGPVMLEKFLLNTNLIGPFDKSLAAAATSGCGKAANGSGWTWGG